MKLSEYAKQQGTSYSTAFRWWKAGNIKGYQAPTGTIIVTTEEPIGKTEKLALYARVSTRERKNNLERQFERLSSYCAAKGYQINLVVKEIASGVNDSRPKLLVLLKDTTITRLVVEQKDRLTRFRFNYLETLLEAQGRAIEVVNGAENDKALPRKVSNDILRLLDKNWKAFFNALKAYGEDPSKFFGRPRLPNSKEKDGRNVLIYDIQALSKTGLRKGLVIPSQLSITIQTKQTNVKQARIVPRNGFYIVEVVYERAGAQAEVNPKLIAGVDIGLNNLAAVTSNKSGFVPRVVNGRPIKSINQWYNKERGRLQAILSREKRSNSHKLDQLTNRRTRRIDHYLHTASKRIIDLLVQEGLGTLIIGKNPEWKQEINIGRRNNQNFVQVPHARFIQMLTYKAQFVGIQVILTEESHTSKCSFSIVKRSGIMSTI